MGRAREYIGASSAAAMWHLILICVGMGNVWVGGLHHPHPGWVLVCCVGVEWVRWDTAWREVLLLCLVMYSQWWEQGLKRVVVMGVGKSPPSPSTRLMRGIINLGHESKVMDKTQSTTKLEGGVGTSLCCWLILYKKYCKRQYKFFPLLYFVGIKKKTAQTQPYFL